MRRDASAPRAEVLMMAFGGANSQRAHKAWPRDTTDSVSLVHRPGRTWRRRQLPT